MLKTTVQYEDLDGNPVTEDLYFDLTEAEVIELEVSKPTGLGEYLTEVVRSKNGNRIITAFKEIVAKAYGKPAPDKSGLIKTETQTQIFMGSRAYSKFFMQLVTNAEDASRFVNAIMPKDMEKTAEKLRGGGSPETTSLPSSDDPAWLREGRDPNPKEFQEATPEQLQEAFRRKLDKQSSN